MEGNSHDKIVDANSVMAACEPITEAEQAEQARLHAEFWAQAEKDPVFMERLRRSHADAKAGRFVDLKKLKPLADALAGLAEEEKENMEV